MSTSAYSDDLAFAHSLADIADAITLDRYQAQDLVITTKPDNTPVTDADRATEKAMRMPQDIGSLIQLMEQKISCEEFQHGRLLLV